MPETQTTAAASTAGPDTGATAATSTAAAGNAQATTAAATATTAQAAAATKAAPTALTASTTEQPPAADWRAAYGTDDKLQKLLGRYSSAEAFGKAHLEAVGTISKGVKQAPKEGASAEEIAAYRKDIGVPEKPDGYFEKLPGGLVLGEEDKGLFGEWGAAMHKLNAPPALIAETVKWYYGMQEQQAANQEAMDRQHQTETTTALRTAWGRDYTENINLVNSMLGGLQEETRALFMDATMPDGRRLFNSPEIIQWLGQKARELNPLAFIPGPSAGDEGKTLDQRIEAIEATMGTPAYVKNEKVQAELRQLYERRSQLQTRGAA